MGRVVLLAFVLLCVSSPSHSQSPEPIGPHGGYIRSMAVGPDGEVYVGTEFGGVYRTADDGSTWTQIFDFHLIDGPVSVRSLALDDTDVLWAGTDGFGLLRFDGAGWQRPFTVLYDRLITTILPLPADRFLVGTLDGLYGSTDRGQSFSIVTDVPTSSITALHADPSGSLFAAAYFNGLHRSDDGGGTWQEILNTLPEPVWAVTSDSQTGDLYISAGSEIFVSSDGGATATSLNAPTATYSNLVILQHNGPEVFGSAVSVNNAAGGGIVFSNDGGSTWTWQDGLPDQAVSTMVNPRDLLIVGGTLGLGIFGKEDWGSVGGFEARNDGLTNTFVEDLDETPAGTLVAGTRYGGVYTRAPGDLWTNANWSPPQKWVRNVAVSGATGTILVSTQEGKVFRSEDAATWTEVSLPQAPHTLGWGPSGYFAGYIDPVYVSHDDAATFTPFSFGSSTQITAFAELRPDDVLAATDGDGVLRSDDGGATWHSVNSGLTNLRITSILRTEGIDPTGCLEDVTVGTWGDGLFTATYPLFQWKAVPTLPDVAYVTAMESDPQNGLFVAASSVADRLRARAIVHLTPSACIVAHTDDVDYPVTGMHGTNFAFKSESDVADLLIGTTGGGILRTRVGSGVATEVPDIPVEMPLSQNYPNPFHFETTIRFEVSRTLPVKLVVFDMLGREVALLASGDRPPGTYEVKWNASGHPSGVYLYRLEAGDHVETRRMAVIR